MMRRPDALQYLATYGWLSMTPAEFRKAVFDRLQLREFRKGDTLFRTGDPPGGLWVVVKGAVELETETQLTNFINPGIWFGVWQLIFGRNRHIGAIAVRPTTMATVSLSDCHAILNADPAAWRWIALLAGMLNISAVDRFNEQMLRDPVKRTAATLLRLSGVTRAALWRVEPSPIYLSQQKLALLLAISRTSLLSILADFEKRRYVELQYGSILIANAEGLRGVIELEDDEPGLSGPRGSQNARAAGAPRKAN